MALGQWGFLVSVFVFGAIMNARPAHSEGTSGASAPESQSDASVTFVTEPPGSTIRVNGVQLEGRTPLTLSLASGQATVEFKPPREGFQTVRGQYSWRAGESKQIFCKLPVAYGDIRITTPRQWKSLEIDRLAFSAKADLWNRVQAGRHTILALDGRYFGIARFRVPEGGRQTISLTWSKMSPDPDSFALVQSAKTHVGSAEYSDLNPQRLLRIEAFWIQRYEVTVRQYRECVIDGHCSPPVQGESCNWNTARREDHPVNCVSPLQAAEYAKWFSAHDEFSYRLPTNVEWEYVATAEGKQQYPWGGESPVGRCSTCDRSCVWRWHDTSIDDGWPETAPVGSFKMCTGPDRVYDLIGNVAEWCSTSSPDRYDLRGGSWASPRMLYDPQLPNFKAPRFEDSSTGFRLAATALNLESVWDGSHGNKVLSQNPRSKE